MQARLIAYPPEHAAVVRAVDADAVLRIGRAPDCDLVLDHPSVSRRHAELRREHGAWRVRDLGSKNGTYVDGAPVTDGADLGANGWLRFGDVYCEFALLPDEAQAANDAILRARRTAATAHTARLGGIARLGDLLGASLRAVVELAQCDRGFVLLAEGGDYRVRASLALDPARLATREFSGSVGAVQRALDTRRPVVVNDIGGEAWLAARQSVMAAGLRALVCLPLLDGERVLGAVYADRTRPGPPITTLDVELLQAFTEGAAVWIAARQASEQLQAAAPAPDWRGIVAAQGGR